MARSLGLLETYKAIELRKMAAQMMRENSSLEFLIHGIPQTAAWVQRNGKKDQLIHYISLWEGQLEADRKQKEETPIQTIEAIVEPEIEPIEEVVEPEPETETIEPVQEETMTTATIEPQSEYATSEAEKLKLAKKIYLSTFDKDELTGLREYHLNLCKSGKFFLPEFAILVARSRVMIEAYGNSVSPSGEAHPGSIIALKVAVMKHVKSFVDQDVDKFPLTNERTLQDTFKDFDDAIRGAFKDVSSRKHKMYEKGNRAAEADVRAIEAHYFIQWAKDTLNDLETLSVAKWKEVAIAVMLLTGRRQSEVMSSGVFTYVDPNHVIFEGQLKRHLNELVPPETIPVLANTAEQVIKAIEWLESYGKRTLPTERTYKALQIAASKSHDRCSRYIAETMEKLSNLVPIVNNNKTWEFTKDGKTQNRFKGHLTRQIYAQVCEKLFNDPDETKKRAFLSRILLENVDASLAYDRDIEIKDIDQIRAISGNIH